MHLCIYIYIYTYPRPRQWDHTSLTNTLARNLSWIRLLSAPTGTHSPKTSAAPQPRRPAGTNKASVWKRCGRLMRFEVQSLRHGKAATLAANRSPSSRTPPRFWAKLMGKQLLLVAYEPELLGNPTTTIRSWTSSWLENARLISI